MRELADSARIERFMRAFGHLIQMKLARGRPVDLADVAALTDEGTDSAAE